MTQPIACPACQHLIPIQDPVPGRFRIQCPKCGRKLSMVVVQKPDGSILASIPDPDSEETVEQPARPRFAAPMSRPMVVESSTEESDSPLHDPEPEFKLPRFLGGYRVGEPPSRTRSGISFPARRWPIGARVILSVVKSRWAADSRFMARFAREAFAGSNLRHPNLLRLQAIGSDKGLPFAVFESSGGFPLSDPARGRAGLDRTARAAAILHAARGLRLAHEQGVYHRGLTLGEIRSDRVGLIQVTGLGVGLTPDTPELPIQRSIELAGATGPESPHEPQTSSYALDDIRALGRALLTLVAGVDGDRAVPPGLSIVGRKMAGQGQESPFGDLGAVIRALEAELGVAGPFAPRDDEAAELEACALEFGEPPMLRLRSWIAIGATGFCGLIVSLSFLLGRPGTALGTLAFGALTAWTLMKVRGLFHGDPIYDRVLELALGGTRGDLVTLGAGLTLLVGGLVASGLFGVGVVLGLVATALATAFHFAIDRPIAMARRGAVERAEVLLRGLRRLGVDEIEIRRFVCRQSGLRWEEFYETLLGYDAMRAARARWGDDAGGQRRPRFAPWRDPVVNFLDARLEGRQLDRDQTLLQVTEEHGAEARGINLLTARRKAHRVAQAMVSLARQYRRSPDQSVGLPLMNALVRATERPEEFLAAIENFDGPTDSTGWRDRLDPIARVAFGPRTRFLAGSLLLAGFLVWMHQNQLIDAEQIQRDVMAATADREQAIANAEKLGRALTENVQGVANAQRLTTDVKISYLPSFLAEKIDGFGLGLAGLLLIVSSAFRGVRFAAFAVPGALIAAVGPRLIDPAARTLGTTSLVAMTIGGVLVALGVVFGRVRD